MDAKKKTVGAAERDEARRLIWHQIVRKRDATRLLFVDETGSNTSMTQRYSRSPRGTRAHGVVPRNHGKNVTLVAGLSHTGMVAPMTIDGAMDTPAFEAYVAHILAPTLTPGTLVILDNLAVHHKAAIRTTIEAQGCRLLFLPPYSPDLTPIELAFSKIKTALRRTGARTREALNEALAAAIDTITAQDARGYFHHCGYHSPAQLI
jgi:transposase